jgi:exonuclease III
METNPGTGEKLKIITMNCRGLGEIEKFMLLLNKAHDTMQKCKMIIMIQETMIINSRYLDVAWRGKYVFTTSTGNNQNCITLMHNDVTITDIEHIQNRGHHFKIIEAENKLTLIVNIYALLGYNNEKTDFFNSIMVVMANDAGENVVLSGDFNLTLTDSDSLRRQRTESKKRIADNVNTKINENKLDDAWAGHTGYTWRRGKTQSRLDRIFIRLSLNSIKN